MSNPLFYRTQSEPTLSSRYTYDSFVVVMQSVCSCGVDGWKRLTYRTTLYTFTASGSRQNSLDARAVMQSNPQHHLKPATYRQRNS
jgi:hypothetical protein